MKILRNPTKLDIIDYRIEEIEFDQNGKPLIDSKTGKFKWTGNTLEWSIKAGETLEFPDYVADYLKGIYGFLEEVKEKKEGVVEASKEPTGKIVCKYCGQTFKTPMNLAMHMGSRHPEKIME
jgi:hypothetical protein